MSCVEYLENETQIIKNDYIMSDLNLYGNEYISLKISLLTKWLLSILFYNNIISAIPKPKEAPPTNFTWFLQIKWLTRVIIKGYARSPHLKLYLSNKFFSIFIGLTTRKWLLLQKFFSLLHINKFWLEKTLFKFRLK